MMHGPKNIKLEQMLDFVISIKLNDFFLGFCA